MNDTPVCMINFVSEYSHYSDEERMKIAIDALKAICPEPEKFEIVRKDQDRDIRMRLDWVHLEFRGFPEGFAIPFEPFPGRDSDDPRHMCDYWLPFSHVYKKRIAEYIRSSFVEQVSRIAGKHFNDTGVTMPSMEVWERYAEVAGEGYMHAYEEFQKELRQEQKDAEKTAKAETETHVSE